MAAELTLGDTVELRYLARLWATTVVSMAQFRFLLYLTAFGPATPVRLAEQLGSSHSNACHLATRMEQKGLIRREGYTPGGKCYTITATEEGARLVLSLLRPVMVGDASQDRSV